jgi:hypothetical protein
VATDSAPIETPVESHLAVPSPPDTDPAGVQPTP